MSERRFYYSRSFFTGLPLKHSPPHFLLFHHSTISSRRQRGFCRQRRDLTHRLLLGNILHLTCSHCDVHPPFPQRKRETERGDRRQSCRQGKGCSTAFSQTASEWWVRGGRWGVGDGACSHKWGSALVCHGDRL